MPGTDIPVASAACGAQTGGRAIDDQANGRVPTTGRRAGLSTSTLLGTGQEQGVWVMGPGSLIGMLIVGALAGWLAGKIVAGQGFGLLGNVVVGIVGAFVAGFLLPRLGLGAGGGPIQAILHATFGAVVLLVLVRVVRRG